MHLLLVKCQIPVSLKIDVESKQLCYLNISAKKGDSEDILKRNNRGGYNNWDAGISVFPWFASVNSVPFRLNTQNTPKCCGTVLQENCVNFSYNIKLALGPKIQFYRDVKIDLSAAV